MLESNADLWTTPTDIVCITTNGSVSKSGRAVMGRGCALEAKQMFPGIDRELGRLIRLNGNHVQFLITANGKSLYTFPVKHDWWERADLPLIKRSCIELMHEVPFRRVLLPRPGCGNGKLDWADVKPLVSRWLGDNVTVVSR